MANEAVCPLDGAPDAQPLAPTERLYVPHRKRLHCEHIVNAEGVRELRIDYGLKEVTFDEARLFPFGEQIVREASFTGEQATQWGPGYAWDELQPMLEALIEEGIIRRGEGGEGGEHARGGGLVPSLLPPAVATQPRFWSLAECESLTRDLAGREVELGYLELFVPVFRVAHPALDADGRQVGEGNVFPGELRLDCDTEWRVCQYAGSRYRDETPMNVTGLKAMIKHWKPMLATILEIRREVQRRLPATLARWTTGELYVLSSIVLAVAGYPLMKRGGTSPQIPLHPVLSSMFRITDGIRMTTSDMMYSVERTRPVDEVVNAQIVYAHAEHEGVLIGETGVCAGPHAMIDDFLTTVIDRAPAPRDVTIAVPPEVEAVLAELPEAVDYGMYGLQSHGSSLPVWLCMARAYQAVLAILDETGSHGIDVDDVGEKATVRLRERLRHELEMLARIEITLEHDRGVHYKVYVEAYEQGWRGSRVRVGPPTLAEAITPVAATHHHHAAAAQLRTLLAGRLAIAGAARDRLVEVLIDYLRQEEAILAINTQLQAAINAVLERPRPERPLTVRDLRVGYTMSPITQKRMGTFPYLFDTLEDELGIFVECTAGAIAIADRRAYAPD